MKANPVFHLPRFDDLKGLSPLAVFDEPSKAPEVAVEALQVEVPEVIVDVSPTNCKDSLHEEMQTLLENFASAVQQMHASASEEISFSIRAIASELFPRLSSAFLAEEFALHMPEIVKLVPPSARIQAPTRIAEDLEFVSRGMENWPTGWAIEAVDGLKEARVEVIWDQGGLTYNLDKILAACLSRLGEHINGIEEK
jgi:hypothetical protein